MLNFLFRRLVWNIFVLVGILGVAFLLMHAIPGSPWDKSPERMALGNFSMDETTRKTLDRRFGLDKPLWRQFTRYVIGDLDEGSVFVCGVVCGNFGPSYRQRGRSVQDILFGAPENGTRWNSRFVYSLRLSMLALAGIVLTGLVGGILAAIFRNSFLDRVISFLATIGISIPNFVIGLVLLIVLATGLGLINVRQNWSEPRSWVLPAVVLAFVPSGMLARLTRTAVLEVLSQDYVRTAHGKGLPAHTVLTVHVLRNASIPLMTYVGPIFLELVAGSLVIESMFGFPGMGREYWEAVIYRDYTMIMAITLLDGVFLVLANMGVDFLYTVLDPRIRIG
jgi:oligopeptide transport system permease protein